MLQRGWTGSCQEGNSTITFHFISFPSTAFFSPFTSSNYRCRPVYLPVTRYEQQLAGYLLSPQRNNNVLSGLKQMQFDEYNFHVFLWFYHDAGIHRHFFVVLIFLRDFPLSPSPLTPFLCTWEGYCLNRWCSGGKKCQTTTQNRLPHQHFLSKQQEYKQRREYPQISTPLILWPSDVL